MPSSVKIRILGSGQDGGIPHTGCACRTCNKARKYKKYRRLGPSIAVFDRQARFSYLIDASPDFKAQVDMAREEIKQVKREGKIPISGIMLTHAHFGHYTGLLHLGKEVLDERHLPVFCTPSMKQFLQASHPFMSLIQNRNIILREIRPAMGFALDGIRFIPLQVPHRSDLTDTVGYIIEADRRVIYIPDTDRWTDQMIDEIAACDIAIIDGTFYSENELPRYREVPHPPVSEAVRLLKDVDTRIYFTHINHTNPINRPSRQRKAIERKGFKIASDGLILNV
jgi:pyrroloquinoline quinone biosynthesis protein B